MEITTDDVPISLRILVVEDDPATLESTVDMLETLGHWATGVRSAELALDRYIEGAFDVLLLDICLPALSGLDLFQSLKDRHGARVIFASGRAKPESPIPGTIWLQKPFGAEELGRALKSAACTC